MEASSLGGGLAQQRVNVSLVSAKSNGTLKKNGGTGPERGKEHLDMGSFPASTHPDVRKIEFNLNSGSC